MRIYKNKYYIFRDHPGLSGFKQWDKWEYWISTGKQAQSNRTTVFKEYIPNGEGIFRLGDGHCPNQQPTANEKAALAWLDFNPYQRITQL